MKWLSTDKKRIAEKDRSGLAYELWVLLLSRDASRIFIASCLILLAAGCSKPPSPGQRIHIVAAPPPYLILTVPGEVTHRQTEPVKAPVSDLRLAWMASEGSLVEAGEIVTRYDTELLDLWMQANREDLEILERRTRAAEIANDRMFYTLRTQLLEKEADRTSIKLAYALSKDEDQAERGTLERELELARETLTLARQRLETLQQVQSLGGAAAIEVRQAAIAFERARANVKIPEVNLRLFLEQDGSRERIKWDKKLARLGLALGQETEPGSLRNRIAMALSQQSQDLTWVQSEAARLDREATDVQQVIDDAVHRSEEGGVVHRQRRNFAEVPLVPGRELGAGEIGRVIAPQEAVIRLQIPEAMRDSVSMQQNEENFRVKAQIPSLGPDWLAGRLTSVGIVKKSGNGIGQTCHARVELDAWPEGFSVGAGVECRIQMPVPESAVVIPRWWATREFRPVVQLANGETRRLKAQAVGNSLLVRQGLQVGDRIQAPQQTTTRHLVLFSAVEASDQEEISVGKIRFWEWEIEELVEDGVRIKEGQVVARLRKQAGRESSEDSIQLETLKAEAARNFARMSANGKLGNAFMNWQEARIDAETARVEYELERRALDDEDRVQAEVSARLAAIRREQAEEDARRFSAPAYRELRSEDQLIQDQLEAKIARLEDTKARLGKAASRHARNWISLRQVRQEWDKLAAEENRLAQAYKRAQAEHQRELSTAETQYAAKMNRIKNMQLETESETITSPQAGRIFHNTNTYAPLELGERLPTAHLFNLVHGKQRRFTLHVPSRRYQEFETGQTIKFHLPAEGTREQTGTIVHIANFFEKRHSSAGPMRWKSLRKGEVDQNRQATESTVRVQVEFETKSSEAAPPGSTVVVELAGDS